MKKQSLSMLIAASLLASTTAMASSQAHYGLPKGTDNAIPLVVTNHTYATYTVEITQSGGEYSSMPIGSVSSYPINIISVDSPDWPVHVIIHNNRVTIFNQDVYYNDPNVTINPNPSQNSKAATVTVS